MESKQKNRTITIKINGNEHPFDEAVVTNDSDKVEKLRKVEEESMLSKELDLTEQLAAAEEKMEDHFDWILPEQADEELKEYKINYSTSPKKGKSSVYPKSTSKGRMPKWNPSIIISVAFAIILGTSFGFFMLKLLTNDHPKNQPTILENGNLENNETNTQASSNGNKAIPLPTLTTNIIQAGVFSSKESAEQQQEIIMAAGFPSEIVTFDGNFFLFVGTADTLENAKSLSSEFKDKDIGVYAKEWSTGGETKVKFNKDEQKLLTLIPDTYQLLVQQYSSLALGDTPSSDSSHALSSQIEKLKQIKDKNVNNKTIIGIKEDAEKAGNQLSQSKFDVQKDLLSILAKYHSLTSE
ncbi:hypothetical protein ACE38V_14445 [Cytobacillus sp. Hz8]|uniref:hypothetical protein n=1 Tax=Cytobacillus sp. Hz8 TaxID=3347168 RepID=UPI0035D5D9A7